VPRLDIPIHQPEKLKDEPFASWIRAIGPTCDAFVVVSYGKILPQWLLDLPKQGVVNVHGSLLPRWRGPSPIQAAIAAGDAVTGVTIMQLDAEMDHGPILAQQEELIRSNDTGGSLHDRLAILGAKILPDVITNYLASNIQPVEQNHAHATYCKLLTREDGRLDFTKNATEIERVIRAYDPWPGTWHAMEDKRLKILAARVASIIPAPHLMSFTLMPEADPPPAEKALVQLPEDRFVQAGLPHIVCGGGTALMIERLQLEGAGVMTGEEFLRGHAWQ